MTSPLPQGLDDDLSGRPRAQELEQFPEADCLLLRLFQHSRRGRRIEVEHSAFQGLLLAPWRANDGEGLIDLKDVPLDGRTNGAASVRLG
jgi:hypothetical protein